VFLLAEMKLALKLAPTLTLCQPTQVLKKPARKVVIHDDEHSRMLAAVSQPPMVSASIAPTALPSAFKPSAPVSAPAPIPAAPRRQVLPPPPPVVKRPAIASIYYGCHEKGDAFIKKVWNRLTLLYPHERIS
jgi:hypothetical protein